MSRPLTYLVTGASRGLGRAYVEALLTRSSPAATVIAAARNINDEGMKSLASVKAAEGSRLITVKLDVVKEQDAIDALETLKEHDVEHLDVLVHNAGANLEWWAANRLTSAKR